MPCHAGPHGKVPGLVEKQSSKRRTWPFLCFPLEKKKEGQSKMGKFEQVCNWLF